MLVEAVAGPGDAQRAAVVQEPDGADLVRLLMSATGLPAGSADRAGRFSCVRQIRISQASSFLLSSYHSFHQLQRNPPKNFQAAEKVFAFPPRAGTRKKKRGMKIHFCEFCIGLMNCFLSFFTKFRFSTDLQVNSELFRAKYHPANFLHYLTDFRIRESRGCKIFGLPVQ